MTGAVRVFRDRIRVVIAGREHEWPCDFIQPAQDPETGQPLPELQPVLGREGFLHDYAICLDSGFLTVTRLTPLRRCWRRVLHALGKRLGWVHPLDRPL